MPYENTQQLRELLIDNGFKEIDDDLYTKEEWILSIYKSEFEVYNDPIVGGLYYKGTLEELEWILSNL